MQADDDERKDLERAAFARPDDGDPAGRREALRRLHELEDTAAPEDTAEAPSAAGLDSPEDLFASAPDVSAEPPAAIRRRRRPRVLAIGATGLALGALLGGLGASALFSDGDGRDIAVPTPSASATGTTASRIAALLNGWQRTTDLPQGLTLISRGADVYSPAFMTAQDDRLLVTVPDGTTVCLALEHQDGTLAASCAGIDAFFAGQPLRVSGTAERDGAPVYTQITLRPDGAVEGGYQVVPPTP
ncbi:MULTISPECIES: hypothetical protein [unclassified Rathayibacter]|uniref:hypothetical protein n=1 Tax=unclassified Rathayibacter TaxID=2609250 RepID=UPI00188C9C3A|nr:MULTISPECIES: hypothetical protein [unclassified Rathayibacter]MBF4461152.1 hypothetical protein [Rathayibacter sp. VKM Ac-2879]MBF4502563.1 hypothetical protein [Rathayibacter sp. VKM Ac-2878]